MQFIIGIDEVGRGPIAGPVTVCACAIHTGTDIVTLFPKQQLRDSKKLTGKKRQQILLDIQSHIHLQKIYFGIGVVNATRIDEIGISASINEAILVALTSLHAQGISKSTFVFLDGSLHAPEHYKQETIIKGDEKVPEIALASIYAKEHRDRQMREYANQFPGYLFEQHVGYGTSAHYEAIKKYGLTELHRKSFLKRLVL